MYNEDETGLFFNCLPDQMLALKGESCKGATHDAALQPNEYPSLLESLRSHGISEV
jgi:hypothetical protein